MNIDYEGHMGNFESTIKKDLRCCSCQKKNYIIAAWSESAKTRSTGRLFISNTDDDQNYRFFYI